MTNPVDVQRNLDHCMSNIAGARKLMARDMHDAVMMLGTAEMMLTSARTAVRKQAAQLTQVPEQPGTSESSGG